MAKPVSGRDGAADCDRHACGEAERELLAQVAIHADEEHSIAEIDDAMLAKARSVIEVGLCTTASR
jgi:predicted small metal-binding protein